MHAFNSSLKLRLTAVTVALALISVVVAAGSALYFARGTASDNAVEIASRAADAYAAQVAERMQVAMAVARFNAQSLESLHASGMRDRAVLNGLQRDLLEKNPSLLGV